MSLKISQRQTQSTVLAPTMQQSIEVLLLPLAELSIAVEQELQDNPLLEVIEERRASEKEKMDELWQQRLKYYYEDQSPSYNYDFRNDEGSDDNQISRIEPLEDYLLQQLRLELTQPIEIKIGEFIIGNLDEDGYLKCTFDEIADILQIDNMTMIQNVLNTIQNFEPIGIASRDLKECLLTQVHYKCNGESPLIARIIQDHLEDLGRRRYAEIARKLKITLDEAKKAAQIIAHLEPKPARNHRPIASNIYIKPDIKIIKDEDDQYQIQINDENVPPLRINSVYQKMLNQPNRTEEEKNFIKEKMKNALFFIRSIQQRNQTIREIGGYILERQMAFFEEDHRSIKPMILKDVAQAIDRNESTICRAINNKYIDTPQGIFPLKYFFSVAINNQNGNDTISSRSIKEEIKFIINDEDNTKPLSDQDIFGHLAQKGMSVSRRTIAKYRQTLKILPSHLRKV